MDEFSILSNVDWEISRVAESEFESLQPISIHSNGSRNINLVFINERVFI